MDTALTTTTFGFQGYRVVRHLGIARGITVRSRGIVGQLAASLRTIGGAYGSAATFEPGEFDVWQTEQSWGEP